MDNSVDNQTINLSETEGDNTIVLEESIDELKTSDTTQDTEKSSETKEDEVKENQSDLETEVKQLSTSDEDKSNNEDVKLVVNVKKDDKLIDDDEPKIEDINEEAVLEIKPYKKEIENELDEDDIEETIAERLIGLTEMFPDVVRNVGYSVLTGTFPLIKKSYNVTRNYGWIFFSSLAILVVPVSLEKERCQAQRELNRQMLLGGNENAGLNAGIGMAPSPISK